MQKPTQSFSSVLKNRGFSNLWLNQILVQLALNSLNFTLIIWVFQLTNSNTAIAALMLSVYLPAVIFGLFAGVFVDITDRKKIILTIDLLLALAFFSLIFFKPYFLAVLIITFLVNTLSQFYNPAESSAIPLIVKKDQLLVANSLLSITLFTTFLLGFGLAGPLIELLNINNTLAIGGVVLLIAFFLAFLFPSIRSKLDTDSQELKQALQRFNLSHLRRLSLQEIKTTLSLVRSKLSILASIWILAGVQAVIGVIAVLIPSFLEKVIQINATNASYVLVLPLGLGMITGSLLIGKNGHLLSKRRIVGLGILISGLLFFTAGLAPLISPAITYFSTPTPTHFLYQIPLSTILAIGSFLLGVCLVSILVPSQTVLQENTPEQDRGKVFSVLGVSMAALTLIPVLTVGIFADLLGPLPVVLAMGSLITIIGIFALWPDFFFEERHLSIKIREFLGLGHWQQD